MTTIKDVAKLAGVAPSTVSRVLNGESKCAAESVKKRIFDAASKLGYVPSVAAKSLKKGCDALPTNRISILFARNSSIEDSYFSDLARFVKREIICSGCVLGDEYFGDENILPKKTEGLVILGRPKISLNGFIDKFGGRVVFVTLNKVESDGDHVLCDGKEAAKCAMRYLFGKGHRKIAYVGEYSDEIRYVGYKEFLLENKIAANGDYVINTAMSIRGGRRGAEELLKLESLPTAVFCANDMTACGVIERLTESGVKIPSDISVIGIDNIPAAEETTPLLTTVSVPTSELAHLAVLTLCDRLKGGHSRKTMTFLPSTLVVRDSVKRV